MINALQRAMPQLADRNMTLGQARDRYLELKARKRSIAEDRRIFKQLVAAFDDNTRLVDVTAGRISAFKAKLLATKSRQTKKLLSAASVNRPLALLRCLLRLAHDEWAALDSVPTIQLEKEGQGRLRWLTREQAVRLLDKCRDEDKARKWHPVSIADLVEFAMFMGLRRGEALELSWDRVERPRGVIRLEVTKNGQRREVPLSSNAEAVLARRWSDGAKGYVFGTNNWNVFRAAWESAVDAAKLHDFRFHDLRHTFASWLVQRGRSLKEVQEALGHRSVTMANRYAHLGPDHLRAAVAALDDVIPSRAASLGTNSGTNTPREALPEVTAAS